MSYINRIIKFEICEVDKIYWHRTKADHDYNVANVVIRDRRMLVDPLFNYIRKRIPSLQSPSSKYSGATNPRRGNLVKVLFYKQRKGLVLNQISSKKEPPVCRPDPYTKRKKFYQYRPLYQDKNKDFPKEFPDPLKPSCWNWQHGPCFGDARDDEKEPCPGRDWWVVSDFCQEGDSEPSCENCVDIDYPKRYKNSWHKKYSRNTMSCQAPNGRNEWKLYNGTYHRAEAETGNSVVYSEGKGHLTEGNASCDSDLRGHYTFQGEKVSGDVGIGSWEWNTDTEDVPIGQTSKGVRTAGIRLGDNQVNWAWETIDFATKTRIRFYKDGEIEINSCNGSSEITVDGMTGKVTITGSEIVELDATKKIVFKAPLIQCLGFLDHPAGCSCGKCGD